jgi:predicted CXXCH cytochrome family protein
VSAPGGSMEISDGCRSCHGSVRHHRPEAPPGTPASAESGWYRFLKAPDLHDFAASRQGVGGIGAEDWEQAPTAGRHNIYYGRAGVDGGGSRHTNSFCAGCHGHFHSGGSGGAATWLRHPGNHAIPARGEFAALMGAPYNPQVPVAKEDLTLHDPQRIEKGDLLTCLSCHRAHGSPYADMLRWDYGGMRAHDAGPEAAGTGCFFCHTEKDG